MHHLHYVFPLRRLYRTALTEHDGFQEEEQKNQPNREEEKFKLHERTPSKKRAKKEEEKILMVKRLSLCAKHNIPKNGQTLTLLKMKSIVHCSKCGLLEVHIV